MDTKDPIPDSSSVDVLDESSHQSFVPFWWDDTIASGTELKQDEKKGRGLYATRNILDGEKFFTGDIVLSGSTEEMIEVVKVDKRCWQLYPALGCPLDDNGAKDLAEKIVDHNCFYSQITGKDQIYLHHSMINHSCDPNACHSGKYDAIVALRDIQVGEEITIAYLANICNMKKRQERNRALKNWMKQCYCSLCTIHPEDKCKKD